MITSTELDRKQGILLGLGDAMGGALTLQRTAEFIAIVVSDAEPATAAMALDADDRRALIAALQAADSP